MRGLILIDDDFQNPGVLRARLNTMGFYVAWVHVVTILGNQWVKKSKFEGIILNFDMRHMMEWPCSKAFTNSVSRPQ